MAAAQQRSGPLHRLERKTRPDPPADLPAEGGIGRRVADPVEIGLGNAAVPGVKPLRYLPRGKDPHILRQMGVEGKRQFFAGDSAVGKKADAVGQRMDPRIGAGAALDLLPAADHRRDGILHHLRHGQRVLLDLKSMIAGAEIGQREGEMPPHHSSPHTRSELPITTNTTTQIAVSR